MAAYIFWLRLEKVDEREGELGVVEGADVLPIQVLFMQSRREDMDV